MGLITTMTGRLCAGDDGLAPTVTMRRITGREEELSFDLARVQGTASGADMDRILKERIRQTVCAIDGKPVTYDDVGSLNERFTVKQIRYLEIMYAELNGVPQEEMEDFRASLRLNSGETSPESPAMGGSR